MQRRLLIGCYLGAALAACDHQPGWLPGDPLDTGTDRTLPHAVDMADAARDAGVPDAPAPITCKLPHKVLALSGGAATISGQVKPGETASAVNFTDCTQRHVYGVDHVYAARVEVGATYRVTLTPGQGYDVSVYVFTDCEQPSKSCVAGADDNYGGAAESTTFRATRPVHFIAVDSLYPAGYVLSFGTYVLSLERLSVPPNDTCAKATVLGIKGSGATAKGDTALASDHSALGATGCTGYGSPGPDVFYAVALEAGKEYAVTLTPGPSFDSMLYAYAGGCGSAQTTCIAGHDSLGTGEAETLRLKPKVDATYTIAVDSFEAAASGDFVLQVRETRPPVNDTCANATPLALSGGAVTTTGDTSFAGHSLALPATGCTRAPTRGPDVFYAVTLTAGESYLINLIPDGGYNVSLYLLTGCGAGACVTGADVALFGLSEQISFSPPATGTYIIGVGSRYPITDALGSGTFTLMIQQWKPAANDTCHAPKKLLWSKGSAKASGDTFVATNQVSFSTAKGCSATRGEGPDLFYGVDLTAGKSYRVIVTPKAKVDLAAYVFTGCAAVQKTCLGGADSATGGGAEELLIKPATSGAHIIGVDAYSFGQWGAFDLQVSEAAAPANDICVAATTLSWNKGRASIVGDTTLAGNTVQLSASLGCTGASFQGGDLFYSVAFAAGKTYRVSARPAKGFDLALLMLSGCGGPLAACVKGADRELAGAEEVLFFTPSTSGAHVIGVGSRYAPGTYASRGPFTLDVTEVGKPTNDTCAKAAPLALAGGVGKVVGDTGLASNSMKLTGKGCTSFASPGPDLFYSVTLDGGKTYKVTLFSTATFDPMLYALTGCGAAACVAGSDVPGDGKVEALTLSPKVKTTYTIGIDSHGAFETGAFALYVK